MNLLPYGVLMLDGTLTARFLNREAERLASANDGLMVRQGAVSAERPAESRALSDAVHRTLDAAAGASLFQGAALRLPRSNGNLDLEVLIVPLRADRLSVFPARPTAVMFVIDPEKTLLPIEHLLTTLYGLTPAEAALAALLANGKTVEECAAIRSITRETVRSTLKVVLNKTGSSRQADLIRRISQGPASLVRRHPGNTDPD